MLHNADAECLADDPGREAREDVARVATALVQALAAQGHEVRLVAARAGELGFFEELRRLAPDLVVNLCESLAADSRGEMVVPGLLDVLGLAYTGSGALALGLSLHKHKAKDVLRARGVPTPGFLVVDRVEQLAAFDLRLPVIVKPSREDASVGVDFDSVCDDLGQLRAAVERVLTTFRQPALVEEFIAGREIYVPLLGNGVRLPLPMTEVRFGPAFEGRPNIVSYAAKWLAASDEYRDTATAPCILDPATEARVRAVAFAAFDALECRDYGRVDLRLAPDGQPWVIEVNPNCDLHPDAGFARAALAAGLSYEALAAKLVEVALARTPETHGHPTPRAARPGSARTPAVAHRELHPGRGGGRARAPRPRAHPEPSGLPLAGGAPGRAGGGVHPVRPDPDDRRHLGPVLDRVGPGPARQARGSKPVRSDGVVAPDAGGAADPRGDVVHGGLRRDAQVLRRDELP